MKKNIKILGITIILFIIIFSLFMFRSSLSAFISQIMGKSTTEIANQIFIMEESDKKFLNDENTEVDYYFTIKNFNKDGERSQVDLKYIIEILPTLDKSIILTLYKNEEIITLKNQKTEYIEMKQDSDKIDQYRLNVKYDRDKSDSTVDIKQNIYIKANAIQI